MHGFHLGIFGGAGESRPQRMSLWKITITLWVIAFVIAGFTIWSLTAYGMEYPTDARSKNVTSAATFVSWVTPSPYASSSTTFLWYTNMYHSAEHSLMCGPTKVTGARPGTALANIAQDLHYACVGYSVKTDAGSANVIYTFGTPSPAQAASVSIGAVTVDTSGLESKSQQMFELLAWGFLVSLFLYVFFGFVRSFVHRL